MNQSVRIVLVGTTHAGNIGGAARAMKNMAVGELYLVSPCQFRTYEAYSRASGANDIIDNAIVCETLGEALEGCHLVFGTSARSRTLQSEVTDLRHAAASLCELPEGRKAAVVFGRERSGLTNEELDLCHRRVHIPTNPEFSSLNLAAAVQLSVYEISLALQQVRSGGKESQTLEPAPVEDMERFYEHLGNNLQATGFLDPENPRLLMRRLRRLFNRAQPDKSELAILRGILAASDKAIKS